MTTAPQLPLSTVISVSISQTPTGISAFNVNNLAIFTSDTAGGNFGSNGYKIYFEPTSVGVDFGTTSTTYQMAVAIFSQQPNILAGGGYLVIITFQSSETLQAALTRTLPLVSYCGVLAAQIETQGDMLASGAILQANNLIGFFAQNNSATVASGGAIDLLRTGSLTYSRGLYYGSADTLSAVLYSAAYAGRALSTNFQGSKTTQTMNMKNLATVQPDPTMTSTLFTQSAAAGADIYPGVAGVPKVISNGTNNFFDQVYNLIWFVTAIQTAGFNFLATTSTKVPQTEDGMDGLKNAYMGVCSQAVTNGYAAPGTWTSPDTFGNQIDFFNNISQRGFYIYSAPIAQQDPTSRANRAAPVCQIALKQAGAMHTSSLIVNVNA